MACRERGVSKIFLCLGLFLVATCHCKRLTKLKALDTFRRNSTLGHSQAKGGEVHHGRLLIGQNYLQGAKLKGNETTKNLLDDDTEYQADMGWGQLQQPKEKDDGFSRLKKEDATVERLLKMEPKVECTGDSMKLQVQDAASTPGSLLFVDRGNDRSPLPLSKLPPSCGYTIRSTRRDLVLVAPYDGCFVTLHEDSYILPLRWWGLPVRMSCPLMRQASPNPPVVTCHAEGMVVKTEWTVPVTKIKVNLNGNWEPLMKASPRCGFSVVVHPEGVVISVSYASCLEKKDGMYTLELAGDGETKISCPSLSPAQAEPIKIPAKAPKDQTKTTTKGVYPTTPSHNSASTRAPDPTSKNPPQSAIPQVQGFPENPKVPNKKPNQRPEDIHQPQLPYFPLPPDFFHPANPDPNPTPTVQPTPPPATKKNRQQSHHTVPPWGQMYPQFNPYAFLPQGPYQMPVLSTQPEPTPAPESQDEQPFIPLKTEVYKPIAPENLAPSEPPAPESNKADDPQGQAYQLFYPNPLYPGPKGENLPSSVPPPEDPRGQVHQQFNPSYYPQPEAELPAEKQPAVPKPSQPEVPQGQVHQQFNSYYYPQPEAGSRPAEKPTAAPKPPATEKPTAVPQPPQPEAPQGQVHQQFNPYYYYYPQPEAEHLPAEKPTAAPKPPATEKPTAVPQPPQPEAPQGQVHQQFNPYYYYYPQPEAGSQPAEKPTAAPKPPATEKPTAVPQPPYPEAPQGQVHQQFNPYYYYYPQPEAGSQPAEKPTAAPKPPATEKPTAVPQPPQPEAPQGQVHQQFNPYYYYYPQPEAEHLPAEKPTAAPKPPATEKPTAVPQPPQPEAPQGQVHQQFNPYYYYYPQPEAEHLPAEKPTAAPKPPATEKPTAVPQPPQPEAPQGQVHQQFNPYYYYYPQPEAGSQPAEKPTAAPKPPATEKPTAVPQPPYPEAPQGQVHKQFNPYYYYYSQLEAENLPDEKPTAVSTLPVPTEQPPAVKPPRGQVPYYSQQPKHPQPVTLPPVTAMQQPQQVTTLVSSQDPPESAIPKPSNVGKVPQDPQGGSVYMPPMHCPQYCPPGLTNCCPQIAFHQHLHHIVPAGPGIENLPSIYPGLPFLPPLAYSGFDGAFGSTTLPQKPAEAATTSTSAPISTQSPPSGNVKQPYFQPPDGNPAVLPGNNPSKPTNLEQMYPYFVPNSLHPGWPYQQPNELQNLPQRQSSAHYSVPSKPQAPGSGPVNQMVSNIQLPKQQNNQPSAGDLNKPSSPNFWPLFSQGVRHLVAKRQNRPVGPNNSTHPQPLLNGSNKSPSYEQNLKPYFEPKSYVLLQHGPPGREPNSFNESPLSFRDLVHDQNFLAQNLARQQGGKPQHPQNLMPAREKPQQPKWQRKVMSYPLPGNVNYMPGPGEKSESLPLLYSASDVPHFVPLPQDPSLNAGHLKPKVLD